MNQKRMEAVCLTGLQLQAYLAKDMIDRNRPDETAVRAVVPVVPHDEYIAFRNSIRSVHRKFHWFIDIWFIQLFTISIYVSVIEFQLVSRFSDNSFDPDIMTLSTMLENGNLIIKRFCEIIHPGSFPVGPAVYDDDIPVIRSFSKYVADF